MIVDQQARNQALDPRGSFIVQAPAGAGKTELLTQRFLALLANVNELPEEILAVTFTKKAAGEMRTRIVNALLQAKMRDEPPSEPHEHKTWQLARAALVKNDANQWQLIENPNRLRIVTIDALCAKLVNKMPILSQVGGDFNVVEYAKSLYEEAARALLSQTAVDEKWADALGVLLLHCDNRIEKIVNLLVMLLSKRDQWLPYLPYLSQGRDQLESYFNHSLGQLIDNHLQQLRELFPQSVVPELMTQASQAAQLCQELGNADKIAALVGQVALPRGNTVDLALWQGLAELLLTKDGGYRKRFDQSIGFLSQSAAKDKTEKAKRKECQERIKAVVADLAEISGLNEQLHVVHLLPNPCLTQQHLSVLEALGELLPVLVAHLQVIFQETGQVDFIEVNLRASNALGESLEPSEILLKLDYQLRHILIDEYQDTSVAQYRLFEKLVSGWQKNDGRTLFLVGDPMQSIYRFRGAEVSLFLHTQEKGIGEILPTPLTLQVNFRSSQKVIHWINQTFVDIFPKSVNKTFGAVNYSHAYAAKNLEQSEVNIIAVQKGEEDIAEKAVEAIVQSLAQDPNGTIAVLGRTRRHLAPIISLLRKLNIGFVAHEVDYLAMRMHVMDCLSLLRATNDLTDKISWYAILRAPWLGLSLSDIFALSQFNSTGIIWNALLQFSQCPGLSSDAVQKLKVFVPQCQYWFDNRRRKPLNEWLRGLWLSIGGPYCYQEPIQKDLDAIFKLIGDCEVGGSLSDLATFSDRLAQLYADAEHNPGSEIATRVELLTLHKAKGLEFDTVIMPYLHTRPKRNDPALLLWFEYALTSQVDLLLAPYRFVAQTFDPLYRYVDHCLSQKDNFEIARLLYVGATRAKNNLVLLGEYEYDDKGELKAPPKGSFWEMLWPFVDTTSLTNKSDRTAVSQQRQQLENQLMRFSKPFELPLLKTAKAMSQDDSLNHPEMGDYVAKCTGTVFHRLLQRLSEQRLDDSHRDVADACQLALKRLGLSNHELTEATKQVMHALENFFNDDKGRWILDKSHHARSSEWALSYQTAKGIENIIIDYSFIDKEGIRWIIDYKLTHHQKMSQEELAHEVAKYRAQLNKYRRVVSALEQRVVRCGLYFPLAQVFTEIDNGVLND
ncbi:MAG: UvrD-helicase domain-containing protein [Candidatus Berkiella sp.]